MTEEYLGPDEKMECYETTDSVPVKKNFYVLCIACFFYCSALNGVNTVQSSVNFDKGLGVTMTSITYGVSVVANMFWAAILTRKFGLKYTLILGMTVQSTYFLSNLYPAWYTMAPTAILSGVLTACLWPAKNAYISRLGGMTGSDGKTPIVERLFGIYYLFNYFSNILATLFSYLVLEVHSEENLISPFCGLDFCDYLTSTNGTNFAPISTLKRGLLFGGFFSMAVLAIVLLLFLDQVGLGPPLTQKEYAGLSLSTIRQFRDKNQILLSVANFYRGISYGFISADFTKAIVTCSFGISKVGFVVMAFGAACGISSLVFSHLVKRLGRIPIFVLFVSTHAFLITSMFTWLAHPEDNALYIYLIMAGIWGVGHSVLEYQMAALYKYLFPESTERAYNAYQLVDDLGRSYSFAVSSLLCFSTKLYILSAVLGLTAIGYFMIEIPLRHLLKTSPSLEQQLDVQ